MTMHSEFWPDIVPPIGIARGDVFSEDAARLGDAAHDALDVLLPAARAAVRAVLGRRAAAAPRGGASLRGLAQVVEALPVEPVVRCVALLQSARIYRRAVFALGVGESAAVASSFASDLTRLEVGPAPRAIRFLGGPGPRDSADAHLGERYANHLRVLIQAADVVLAVARAGETVTLASALEVATSSGATTVLLTSQEVAAETHERPCAEARADVTIVVPSARPEHVMSAQLYVEHVVRTALIELESTARATSEVVARTQH